MHIGDQTRLQYLKDHGIHKEDDWVFIDTGFSGNIPMHIMEDLFDMSDLDSMSKRILMIHSNTDTVMPREDAQIIKSDRNGTRMATTDIETAPKPEDAADTLYKHESGKIKAAGHQNDPVTTFRYDVLRHIIMRHFYLDGLYKINKLDNSKPKE
jgi:hypothetical protein